MLLVKAPRLNGLRSHARRSSGESPSTAGLTALVLGNRRARARGSRRDLTLLAPADGRTPPAQTGAGAADMGEESLPTCAPRFRSRWPSGGSCSSQLYELVLSTCCEAAKAAAPVRRRNRTRPRSCSSELLSAGGVESGQAAQRDSRDCRAAGSDRRRRDRVRAIGGRGHGVRILSSVP